MKKDKKYRVTLLTRSVFQDDPMPDPGIYVDNSVHQFEKRLVRKFAEKQDIDALCAENFDIYMNFMVRDLPTLGKCRSLSLAPSNLTGHF